MIMVVGSRTGMWSYRTSLLKITSSLYGAVEPKETVYGDCYVCSDFMIRMLPNPGDIDGFSITMVFGKRTFCEENIYKHLYHKGCVKVVSYETTPRMRNLNTNEKYILKDMS